uniref:Uncharacterized protein n=1 Tax=Romanomermis culicivorax TaxID=13658 RepID=A0A915KNU4_ROMCU
MQLATPSETLVTSAPPFAKLTVLCLHQRLLSARLAKPAFDKQSLQLSICGRIKVAHSAVVNAHGPVVVTIESAFSEHMIKCVILDNEGNDQCIIGTNFLPHPDIHAILNFKENYIEIQDVKLPLKVITSVHPQMELFLNTANDNVLEETPEEEQFRFHHIANNGSTAPSSLQQLQPFQMQLFKS